MAKTIWNLKPRVETIWDLNRLVPIGPKDSEFLYEILLDLKLIKPLKGWYVCELLKTPMEIEKIILKQDLPLFFWQYRLKRAVCRRLEVIASRIHINLRKR